MGTAYNEFGCTKILAITRTLLTAVLTRMHSGGMRTARFSCHLGAGGCLPRECKPRGSVSIAVNDFDVKKSALYNWALVVAELVLCRAQCKYTHTSFSLLVLIVCPHLLHRTTLCLMQSSIRTSQQVVMLYFPTLLLLSSFISSIRIFHWSDSGPRNCRRNCVKYACMRGRLPGML